MLARLLCLTLSDCLQLELFYTVASLVIPACFTPLFSLLKQVGLDLYASTSLSHDLFLVLVLFIGRPQDAS